METLKELFKANPDNYGWLGYQKLLEADIRRSSIGKVKGRANEGNPYPEK